MAHGLVLHETVSQVLKGAFTMGSKVRILTNMHIGVLAKLVWNFSLVKHGGEALNKTYNIVTVKVVAQPFSGSA